MIVKYSEKDVFELTDMEFKLALENWNKGKSVFVSRLGVSLSPYYRWAGREPSDLNIGFTHDGRKVFKRFGEWRFLECPELTPDMRFYPELTKDELPSSKELALK